MRIFALTSLITFCTACGYSSHSSVSPLHDVQIKRDALVNSFDPETMPRCDKVTFLALLDAFTKRDMGVDAYEFPSGKWNRDLVPCYPDESKSETSLDSYLSVLHLAQSRRDARIAERIIDYAEPRDWLTGDGDEGVTSILPLVPMLRQLADKDPARLADSGDASPVLSGFRGHLLASYIWLSGRVYGSVNAAWMIALKKLAAETPTSPFFDALVHRFTDGDYTDAIRKLNALTDSEALWGSCPFPAYWAITVAVMEGK